LVEQAGDSEEEEEEEEEERATGSPQREVSAVRPVHMLQRVPVYRKACAPGCR